jgi:hypothetical protein
MSTGFRRGMAVVAVLLLAGCLLAGQTGVQDIGAARVSSSAGLTSAAEQCHPYSLLPKVPDMIYDNDVGVSGIISPGDFAGLGDRIFPRGNVANFGSQTQTNIAAIFVIYDSAAGARVYGPETVDVASLDSGEVATVTFPLWDPPLEERVYFDTMVTVLQGDEDTTNDWKAGRFSIAVWGERHLTYNDGETGLQGGYTWVSPSYSIGVRFPGPCPVTQIAVGLLGYSYKPAGPYPCTCKVRLNDGPDGMPGTTVWEQPLMFYTDSGRDYINYVVLDPPATVTSDSFYVTWKPQEVAPPYPSFDWDEPIQTGNDFGTDPGYENWGALDIGGAATDAKGDLIIDAYSAGQVLDGLPKGIAIPQGQFDSIATFVPQLVVMNAGLLGRDDIMTRLFITGPSDDGDTVYAGTANTGPVQSCETRTATFTDSVTLTTGNYTMTGITLLPYDGRTGNDTLVRPFTVGLGVADAKAGPRRASVSIAPNPLARTATVRYALPGAGFAALDVYDAAGQKMLSQTITAGRVGTTSLDLSKLQAGVYIVKVNAGSFSSTQKLVVQHR